MSRVSARIHGLDTLRALAVTLVVLHHYVLFVSGTGTFGWVGEIGWVGVDLFFALSGYLIGNQIFQAQRSAGGLSLGRFYARRLLRTLPNFYAVLALYALWPAFRGDAPMLPLWKYLSFTQNIGLEPGTAFSHAWSLCIEEQFYLLLPVCALLAAALGGREDGPGGSRLRRVWAAFALAVAAGMAVRAGTWLHGQDDGHWLHFYYKHIYYSSFCRLDELLAGVALALLKNFHGGIWARLMGQGRLLLAAGIAACALALRCFLADHYGLWTTVFGFPLLALGCALLIVAALAPDSPLHRIRVPGASSLALWSYAVYLVHKQVSVLSAQPLEEAGYGPGHPLTVVLALAASVLAGWLLFRLVETPFMRLRERYVPGNSRGSSLAAAVR
ncbi:acyltransferase family protein [Massilia sp. 2TAF26]|uniref:acyltransferase family protein n=1 Tax=Massilia sp. 2TAF26 TaxID=3233012 RepID=UPI003F978997